MSSIQPQIKAGRSRPRQGPRRRRGGMRGPNPRFTDQLAKSIGAGVSQAFRDNKATDTKTVAGANALMTKIMASKRLEEFEAQWIRTVTDPLGQSRSGMKFSVGIPDADDEFTLPIVEYGELDVAAGTLANGIGYVRINEPMQTGSASEQRMATMVYKNSAGAGNPNSMTHVLSGQNDLAHALCDNASRYRIIAGAIRIAPNTAKDTQGGSFKANIALRKRFLTNAGAPTYETAANLDAAFPGLADFAMEQGITARLKYSNQNNIYRVRTADLDDAAQDNYPAVGIKLTGLPTTCGFKIQVIRYLEVIVNPGACPIAQSMSRSSPRFEELVALIQDAAYVTEANSFKDILRKVKEYAPKIQAKLGDSRILKSMSNAADIAGKVASFASLWV